MINQPFSNPEENEATAWIRLSLEGRLISASPHLMNFLGLTEEEWLGHNWLNIMPNLPFPFPGTLQGLAGYWPENAWISTQLIHSSHSPEPLEIAWQQEAGDGQTIILSLRRPYLRHCNPDDLDRLQSRAHYSSDSICVTDCRGAIVYVNPVFEQLTGYIALEAVGQNHSLLKSGLHSSAFYQRLWQELTAGREFQGLFVNRKKSGELYHEDKHIRPFIDGSGNITHFVAKGRDVSASIQAKERLGYLATHDALTGLPNRFLFKERLLRELERGRNFGGHFAVCIMDVDKLKPVNDRYGHSAGDLMLRTVGEALKRSVRQDDTVARLGGDEFGLILTGVSQRQSVRFVLSKLLRALLQGAKERALSFPVSVSIGTSLYPVDSDQASSLLGQADLAMYRAKAAGGGGFCFFDPDLDQGTWETLDLADWIESRESSLLPGLTEAGEQEQQI